MYKSTIQFISDFAMYKKSSMIRAVESLKFLQIQQFKRSLSTALLLLDPRLREAFPKNFKYIFKLDIPFRQKHHRMVQHIRHL